MPDRRDRMNIGFIGAGKVGCTLGKYFAEGGLEVKGYYSLPEETSLEAARFTNTLRFETAEDLIRECDLVFVTVPDSVIRETWDTIKDHDIKDKIICHCSGAMTSYEAFQGIEQRGASGYSVHPLFAVSDRFSTYRELPGVFFTLEGSTDRIEEVKALLESLGNPVRIIEGSDKTMYHCAAAASSNLVCAILDMSFELMTRCGFTEEDARKAMMSLIKGNVNHVLEVGTEKGLTGPIERNDTTTVSKHLECLSGEDTLQMKETYRLLSLRLADIANRRHPDRDYTGMYQLLGERKEK